VSLPDMTVESRSLKKIPQGILGQGKIFGSNQFFNSGYRGYSMLFNHRQCKMSAEYRGDYFYMHDDVVSLLAHCFGHVYFLPKKLMLYRQHASNITGNIDNSIYSYLRRAFDSKLYVLGAIH
jgi:rhamnosyltransferase